ncbi:hypothetical protein MKW98_013460 [Papaver atlanticum]|uniref:NAD-dependent epimerase/dehydratase domain-containing protein n=1 Tax=Papaver atlanticum TaxID=357466 RepID=A0AAD4SST8_9MAGN|nr:hypothetical protein MKW98_013460 [Papaver atlanticum]
MNGSNRSLEFSGMDYPETKKKRNFAGKILLAAMLTVMGNSCSSNRRSWLYWFACCSLTSKGRVPCNNSGGAGFIGSPAALRLLKDSYRVTIVDNLSWGNFGAVKVLQEQFPEPGRLQFIYAELGDPKAIPINPYGKAKMMAEDIILDFFKNTVMAVMILRYFKVIGSDPKDGWGKLPDLTTGAWSNIRGFTADGTCIRDYIDVTDLVDAHVKALAKVQPRYGKFTSIPKPNLRHRHIAVHVPTSLFTCSV